MIWAMVVLPIILLVMGMPIFTVLMAAASVALIYVLDLPLGLIQTELFGSADNYNLVAVPFFILAGAIMSAGGISERLVNWVLSLFGGIRGSLGLTTVGACTVFSAISGSSAATVAAIGRMLYPALLEKGYPVAVASGFLAASGAIDVVIPPSIAMILYGVAAEESIRYLFIGGILPGLLMAVLMALYIYFTARRLGIREGGKFSFSERRPHHPAGRLGAGHADHHPRRHLYRRIFADRGRGRRLPVRDRRRAVHPSRPHLVGPLEGHDRVRHSDRPGADHRGRGGAVCAAAHHRRAFRRASPPGSRSLQLSPFMVMLMINILLLAVGCVVDPASAILVLAPILKPIVVQAGIDPIHFGVVMTVNLSIGMFTPPFGLNIFVIQGMFKVPLPTLYRGLVPVIGVNLVALAIISAWPGLTLWLVRLIG